MFTNPYSTFPLSLSQYVSGGSLDQLIAGSSDSLPWSTRAGLARDVAAGMAYLHGEGFIHRDLTSKVRGLGRAGAGLMAGLDTFTDVIYLFVAASIVYFEQVMGISCHFAYFQRVNGNTIPCFFLLFCYL